MDVLTLSEVDAARLTREGINRVPTGGAFRAGDEVVVCKMGLVVLHAAWDGECLCQNTSCATIAELPTKRKFSRAGSERLGRSTRSASDGRIKISKPTYAPPSSTGANPPTRRLPEALSIAPSSNGNPGNALVGWLLAAAIAAAGGAGWWFLAPPPDPPYPIAKFAKPINEHVLSIGLHIREGPGTGYSVKSVSLFQNDKVTGFGETTAADGANWQYVRAKGRTFGYVNAQFIASD